jgi:hypothetical protein
MQASDRALVNHGLGQVIEPLARAGRDAGLPRQILPPCAAQCREQLHNGIRADPRNDVRLGTALGQLNPIELRSLFFQRVVHVFMPSVLARRNTTRSGQPLMFMQKLVSKRDKPNPAVSPVRSRFRSMMAIRPTPPCSDVLVLSPDSRRLTFGLRRSRLVHHAIHAV